MARSETPQSGFTLLEVLVAFVILAGTLGVMMRINAQALDTSMRAAERQQALMLAESQLDRVLARSDLLPGTERGDFELDGFRWQLEVSPFTFPGQEELVMESRIIPYRIDISVYWGAASELQLTTLRLGVAP
ncbi:type IV pilus modification PilV family protein [Marinobacterium sediminicola]|uniref:General secretion pathway protein I n=1 Tax=Marinobacterium sediminicola TaxID=518898 RepID=A0ABY1S4W4_9GAMM|nr:prepilin-type N-terminal cleavage/methylation domain-containing protein [Marinobacterium sediminicola]ULG68427.1 prepilin-type N-terminal cleavage/methylation domain-containing protein [Marinobacterium sediminicola]SMR78507.1 general secretion pathway protein I [Marinobacterium sediminicola]